MYEKQTWKSGEIVTEGKLNHMEDGISTGGGIYTYEEVPLFDGEVTTVSDEGTPFVGANITLQGELPKTDIHVTFNGQDYTLPYGNDGVTGDYWGEVGKTVVEGLTVYKPVFTNYPLFIAVYGDGYTVATPEAGTYALKINETVEKFTVNDGFKSALGNILIATLVDTDRLNKTLKEIKDANDTGLVIIKSSDELTEVVVSVNANDDDLGLVSIGYNTGSNKVGTFYYSAATLNSYPIVQNS